MQYMKVDGSEPEVVELAKASGLSIKEVVAMVNQQRYRRAYNQVQMERAKVGRRLMKEHPELVDGLVKEVKS